ncbi:hypothetical protein DFJ74DRAFT_43 [Hyaloraphidium curvatum]|nr:hypothetical protein DFJ74DRAFT_43 [Hyaloraphidium curvatum]
MLAGRGVHRPIGAPMTRIPIFSGEERDSRTFRGPPSASFRGPMSNRDPAVARHVPRPRHTPPPISRPKHGNGLPFAARRAGAAFREDVVPRGVGQAEARGEPGAGGGEGRRGAARLVPVRPLRAAHPEGKGEGGAAEGVVGWGRAQAAGGAGGLGVRGAAGVAPPPLPGPLLGLLPGRRPGTPLPPHRLARHRPPALVALLALRLHAVPRLPPLRGRRVADGGRRTRRSAPRVPGTAPPRGRAAGAGPARGPSGVRPRGVVGAPRGTPRPPAARVPRGPRGGRGEDVLPSRAGRRGQGGGGGVGGGGGGVVAARAVGAGGAGGRKVGVPLTVDGRGWGEMGGGAVRARGARTGRVGTWNRTVFRCAGS